MSTEDGNRSGPRGGDAYADRSPEQVDRWLRHALERAPEIVKVVDAGGTLRYASPAFGRALGYDPAEAVGAMNVFDLVHPEDLPRVLAETGEVLSGAGEGTVEYRFRHKDGSWRWMEGAGTLLPEGPEARGIVVSARDVTGRKEAEEGMRLRDRAISATSDGVVITDPNAPGNPIVHVNPAFERITGYAAGEVLGRNCRFLQDGDTDQPAVGSLRESMREGREFRGVLRNYRKDGSPFFNELRVAPVRDAYGRIANFVGVQTDVTERKALEERLRHQALHDPLTGLPNRPLFLDRLGHALARTRRRRGSRAAVLFVDLDNFKGVNDSLGHEAGDLLLVAVAGRLGGRLRPEDTLARLGGDEFVVLVEDAADPDEAARVAERIAGAFGDPFAVGGRELYARASVGIALGDAATKTPEDLLREADIAMYAAKERGGAFSVFDPAMRERAVGRLELENDLRRAIQQEEFVVRYQPIVRLDGGGVCAVEALVRWEHPERGLLSPGQFVPAAEASGLVIPMGERVLYEACRAGKRWQEGRPRMPPLVVSVNLSARQLARPDLAETVERTLTETGLEARSLSLDVTETVYIKALEGNTGALDRLRSMGVGISIDDFGTGYSSLSYLKRLPADAVKIDRSFVAGLGEDVEDTAIVGMVVELAHTLGMEAVAEGVETEEQARLLEETGCDMAQGFHFAGPLPPGAVPGFLAGRRPPG